MSVSTVTSYRSFRAAWARNLFLRESNSNHPPERLLQKIWLHQRLKQGELHSLKGDRIKVLHPGFWNHEAGPDFLGSMIQFDTHPPKRGDVEVDVSIRGWKDHGHDVNPAFDQTMLRVVWDINGKDPAPDVPCLELKPGLLDSPLNVLTETLMGEIDFPIKWTGDCASPLSQIDPAELKSLLREAALVRLENKSQRFQARARQVGWEASLTEGMMEGLGYKHNQWPFRVLAEKIITTKNSMSVHSFDKLTLQALLFGLSGFLAHEWKGDGTTHRNVDYIKKLWDIWWRCRAELEQDILPIATWHLHAVRPANHPHRRLALAASWLSALPWKSQIDEWIWMDLSPMKRAWKLHDILEPEPDPFWNCRFTLGSDPSMVSLSWLGLSRVTDLAINILLPWYHARTELATNKGLQKRIIDFYLEWPKSEPNSLLRLAMNRLMGRTQGFQLENAAEQQGMLQVLKDYCYESNALCEGCPLPTLLNQSMAKQRSISSSEL